MKKRTLLAVFLLILVSCQLTAPLKPFKTALYSHEAYKEIQLKLNIDSSNCPDWGEEELAVYYVTEESGGYAASIYSNPFKIDLSKARANVSLMWHQEMLERRYTIVLCPFYGKDSYGLNYEKSCWTEETKVSNAMTIDIKVPGCSHKSMKPVKHDMTCPPGVDR